MAELNDSLDQVPFKFSAYSLDQNVDRKKKDEEKRLKLSLIHI